MAGELLAGRGDVHDDALATVITAAAGGPLVSPLWLLNTTATEGWWPKRTPTDFATPLGGRSARALPALGYLTLDGLAVETPEDLHDLELVMRDGLPARPVAWWDEARDEQVFAWLAPKGTTVQVGGGAQHRPHRTVGLTYLHADVRIYGVTETPTTVSGANPTVPNAGVEHTPMRLVAEGPVTGPRWRQMDTDVAIRFDDVVVADGHTLTVDLRARTALVTDDSDPDDPGVTVWPGATRDGGAVPLIDPLLIPPGGAPVGFASEGGATTAVAHTRPAW